MSGLLLIFSWYLCFCEWQFWLPRSGGWTTSTSAGTRWPPLNLSVSGRRKRQTRRLISFTSYRSVSLTLHVSTFSTFHSILLFGWMCFKKDFLLLNGQMLYYVKDPEATVGFFRSLLDNSGKLLIILVSGTKIKNDISLLQSCVCYLCISCFILKLFFLWWASLILLAVSNRFHLFLISDVFHLRLLINPALDCSHLCPHDLAYQ